MKVGDKVKLIAIPPGMYDNKLETQIAFEKRLGKIFEVKGLEPVEGLPEPHAQLDAGEVAVGEESYMHSIWVEQEYLEVQPSE